MVATLDVAFFLRYTTHGFDHLAGEPSPTGFIDFSRGKKRKKKKNVFRLLTHARHGMPGYCFKFEGYGNGEPVVGGCWFFRMDRGWLDYGVLSGIFRMIGFADAWLFLIPWVMNWFLMVDTDWTRGYSRELVNWFLPFYSIDCAIFIRVLLNYILRILYAKMINLKIS